MCNKFKRTIHGRTIPKVLDYKNLLFIYFKLKLVILLIKRVFKLYN